MGHIHTGDGEYDYTASAYIINDNRVLLLMHHKLHLWLPPAGHVEINETPFEAVFREVEEEAGLSRHSLTFLPTSDLYHALKRDDVQIGIPLPFDLEAHPINDTHNHIDFAYAFRSDTDIIRPEEGGASDLRWFTIDEIKNLSPMPASIYSRSRYALELGAKL